MVHRTLRHRQHTLWNTALKLVSRGLPRPRRSHAPRLSADVQSLARTAIYHTIIENRREVTASAVAFHPNLRLQPSALKWRAVITAVLGRGAVALGCAPAA
ncbi:hypothetical protein EVAR_9291_1 [Eumeta japonica]|uniref:Uncharacterized protein n=1 Tax=Eumeta variegata TaxID=151549 RepID=A0A4C1TLW6_EUMVA|nr:hypothetical protein EVAR_9291_1 [Eumeta japonica]